MRRRINNVVQFPVDAQSNLFFCALISAFLAVEKIDENSPLHCGQKRSICINCGNCGDKPIMARHHLGLYHHYLTISGVGLLWEDEAVNDTYHTTYQDDVYLKNLTDRLDFSMKAAGYDYLRLNKNDGKSGIFSQIVNSINDDYPVIMKLGDGEDWHVVTGYDTENDILYGIDAKNHYAVKPTVQPDGYTDDGLFYMANWFENFICAILITGRTEEKLSLCDLLERMILVLSQPGNALLEDKVLKEIDANSNGDSHKLAEWLNNLAGYSVESRWHGAECFTAALYHMTDHAQCKELLCKATDKYLHFHDQCWKIWGLLGVGPNTNYNLSPNVSDLIGQETTRAELKSLFQEIFQLDRDVLDILAQVTRLMSCAK